MYGLVINFSSLEEIDDWIENWREYQLWKIKKMMKKEFENRGLHMKSLHVEAKKYHQDHPELSYKEALKEISKIKKENNNNISI